MKSAVLLFTILFVNVISAAAQCAMCRSTLENNFSNGNPGIGAGINTGILYLLVLPYLAVLVLGYFWFKSSRNAKQELSNGHPGM
jgi:hypothetical protein